MAEYWLEEYDDPTFEVQLQNIIEKLLPLYEQFHGYVRFKLSNVYNISRHRTIPMHLLGNIMAQIWSEVMWRESRVRAKESIIEFAFRSKTSFSRFRIWFSLIWKQVCVHRTIQCAKYWNCRKNISHRWDCHLCQRELIRNFFKNFNFYFDFGPLQFILGLECCWKTSWSPNGLSSGRIQFLWFQELCVRFCRSKNFQNNFQCFYSVCSDFVCADKLVDKICTRCHMKWAISITTCSSAICRCQIIVRQTKASTRHLVTPFCFHFWLRRIWCESVCCEVAKAKVVKCKSSNCFELHWTKYRCSSTLTRLKSFGIPHSAAKLHRKNTIVNFGKWWKNTWDFRRQSNDTNKTSIRRRNFTFQTMSNICGKLLCLLFRMRFMFVNHFAVTCWRLSTSFNFWRDCVKRPVSTIHYDEDTFWPTVIYTEIKLPELRWCNRFTWRRWAVVSYQMSSLLSAGIFFNWETRSIGPTFSRHWSASVKWIIVRCWNFSSRCKTIWRNSIERTKFRLAGKKFLVIIFWSAFCVHFLSLNVFC